MAWVQNSKEHWAYKKDQIWNLARFSCENGECLASTIYDSMTPCDETLQIVYKQMLWVVHQ